MENNGCSAGPLDVAEMTREQILALAAECGMATAPGGNGYWVNAAQMEAFYHAARKPLEQEVERLEEERDVALRGPWAEWAEKSLKIIREHTGYDGCDDQYGVDLPNEIAEAFREMEAEIARLKETCKDHGEIQAALCAQLSAAQAREQQYREALTVLSDAVGRFVSDEGWRQSDMDNMDAADCLLALPTDTTALEAMIQKAGEVMRERSECVFSDPSGKTIYKWDEAVEAIRALPGVTMEDLKQ